MVDSPPPCAMKKSFSVPEIRPLDRYDFHRAKTRASVRWFLAKAYGSAENVPVELQEPLYQDQHQQQHLKPAVSRLLLSPEVYCRTRALLAQAHGVSLPAAQGPPADNAALLQFLMKKGFGPKVHEDEVTEDDLSSAPIRTKAHLALMDSLMALAALEAVGRVKMAEEAEQTGAGSPWENALLFWVNRLNQTLRETTEEEEPTKSQTCTDLQTAQDSCQSNRWYWKLVPHAIAFCLKESGNKPPVIRYRKDKVQSKLSPTFPLVSGVKDLSNGCALAAVLHFYCPAMLRLEDVCLKDTMSVADSLYNLQLVREFCASSLERCCPLAVEDLLYAPPVLHLNIMSFVAELLDWFEVKKPDFVQPVQPIDLTDASGFLDCTSPVNGNRNSGSPSFIFKQPFVPVGSPESPENKSWTKKQISRPLSAVTFSIPFGLDSDVDVVMGNPVDGLARTRSAGTPRLEELGLLLSASAPSQRCSWGSYGEMAAVEEALPVQSPSRDQRKGRMAERGGGGASGGRPEPRLRPEGAPAGFFLHGPEEDELQLGRSAPGRSGLVPRPVGEEEGDTGRRGRGARRPRSGRGADTSRDDDFVLRDGSVDSKEASDDTARNAPGNMRPGNGHQGNGHQGNGHQGDGHQGNGHQGNGSTGNSPRMTTFAERRDHRRRLPDPGEESTSTPTTPGAPQTPSTPSGAPGPGPRGPEPGPGPRGPEPRGPGPRGPGPRGPEPRGPGPRGPEPRGPGPRGPEPDSEASELGARLEEKRKSIEAQKRRIEDVFAKHRQRLGKSAFLQLKRERAEGGGEESLGLEERLRRMEEQLEQQEEREEREEEEENEKGKDGEKLSAPLPPRLEKQVTFSMESKKGAEKEKGGEAVFVEYNEVVQKLSDALQSLQKDMQRLTEQQQQLMSNQRPVNTPRAPRGAAGTPPHTTTPTPTKTTTTTPTKTKTPTPTKTPTKTTTTTTTTTTTPTKTPTKTPPRTPTKTSTRTTSKALVIPGPSGPSSPAAASPSRRLRLRSSSTSPKIIISSSCPAPRTKIHSSTSSTPRSPKHHPHAQHPHAQHPHAQHPHAQHPHAQNPPLPRPSELRFPPLHRALAPTHNVDALPHLRRVSPSKCQVQTSSSFRIGGPRTPQERPRASQPDENASDSASSETPTQFSLELEDVEAVEAVGGLPVFPQPGHHAAGSSSGAPSECSFGSETLSLSAAFSAGGEDGRGGGGAKRCSLIEASLSSPGGPEGGSDVPTDEGQEFSSDSMSDHTESAAEPTGGLAPEPLDPIEQLDLATGAGNLPEQQTEREQTRQTEPLEPSGEPSAARGGIGFFFQGEVHSEEEMAQRRALLLEKQQKRAEELKKRKQWNDQERPASPSTVQYSSSTPPAGLTSPSLTPPATPGRRGGFTRGEHERRHQLRIMEDLDKVLLQKSTTQGRSSNKKTRSRPRSLTREETQLSLSPAKGTAGSKLTKVYSNSSLNLTEEPGRRCGDLKNPNSRPGSASGCVTPSKLATQNGDRDWETGSSGTSPAPEYTGPKLFKEPSFKSNKFIVHNALTRCCLAGKVNESQKNRILEEMEKSPAHHFLILFRDSSCQFRGVYTMNADSQELVRLAGVGPRTIGPAHVESIYKYSSDRKQFSAIPSKTMGMSVDAFTIAGHLWHGGGGGGGAGGGGSRRASITKKAVISK